MPLVHQNRITLSKFDPIYLGPNPTVAYSSHNPASYMFMSFSLADHVAISNVNILKSMNASVPGATSENSSGTERFTYSHGISLFTRQNYGASSTNISCITTASIGFTAGLTYSSGSQSFAMSWVTNSTGGTTSHSTTSGAGNWSSSATGPKMFQIPLVTTLAPGEYFIAHGFSSTTGTTGSDVTLISFSNCHMPAQVLTYGTITSSATFASSGWGGIGMGLATAVTTNATMAASVISANSQAVLWFNFVNG